MADAVRALPLQELRKRKSVKWRRYPSDILPLPIAEMDFPIAEPIKDALRDMIDRSDTGYLGAFPELFDAFAQFSEARWSWKADVEHMRIATDVGAGAVEVMRTLITPGDKVMLNSPVYDNIWNWINEAKATLVDAPLIKNGLEYSMDLDAIEAGYKSGVKVHIFCNPHNPVGIIHTRESLMAIAELASKYGVIVITDEIFAAMTFPEEKFVPFLSVSEAARSVGITVTSASKAFNLAGLKCALIMTGSEELKARINTMPLAVTARASLFGAAASTAAFNEGRSWLDGLLVTLDENRKLLRNLIDTTLPSVGYRVPNFGYLAWLDFTALGLGDDPCEIILERGKVALNKGSLYGPAHNTFGRFNFGTSPEIITEAIDRIALSIR